MDGERRKRSLSEIHLFHVRIACVVCYSLASCGSQAVRVRLFVCARGFLCFSLIYLFGLSCWFVRLCISMRICSLLRCSACPGDHDESKALSSVSVNRRTFIDRDGPRACASRVYHRLPLRRSSRGLPLSIVVLFLSSVFSVLCSVCAVVALVCPVAVCTRRSRILSLVYAVLCAASVTMPGPQSSHCHGVIA